MANLITEEEFQKIDRKLLGARIRQARIERNLTQADLAGDDLTVGYISLIESGQRLPSRKALGKLLDQLGLTISDLIAGVGNLVSAETLYRFEQAEELLASGELEELERLLTSLPARIRQDVRIRALEAESQRIRGETEHALSLSAVVIEDSLLERRWVPAERALVTFSRCVNELNAIYLALNHISRFENLALERECPDHLFMATLEVVKAGFQTAIGDISSASAALSNVRDKWTIFADDQIRGRMFWSYSTVASVAGDFVGALEAALKARELLKPTARDIDDLFLLLQIAGILDSINNIAVIKDRKLPQLVVNTLNARLDVMSPILRARSTMAISNLLIIMGKTPIAESDLKACLEVEGVVDSIHELYFILAYIRWLKATKQTRLIPAVLKRVPKIIKASSDPSEYSEPLNLIGRIAENIGETAIALTCYKYSIKANWNQ